MIRPNLPNICKPTRMEKYKSAINLCAQAAKDTGESLIWLVLMMYIFKHNKPIEITRLSLDVIE